MPSAAKANTRPPQEHKGKEPDEQARAMLVTLYQQGYYAEAEYAARALTKSHPKHVLGWKVLGAALKKQGKTAESLPAMQKAAVLVPKDHEAINNLGVTLQDLGKLDQAAACFQQALRLKPDFADAHGNLGDVWRLLGKSDLALRSYQNKLAVQPDDAATLHHIHALSGHTTTSAPAIYVEGVFNHYAPHFDAHLTGSLKYSIPQQIADCLSRTPKPPTKKGRTRVLDLGCGTGLVGAAINQPDQDLVGVDLSVGMLQMAQRRGIYERLLQSDILSMMRGEPEASYDVITSADVFIYVGQIDEVIHEARRILKPRGLFIFSVESFEPTANDEPGFRLETSGRFSHADRYLRDLAEQHHFSVEQWLEVAIRIEQAQAIDGRLTLWRAREQA